MNPLTTDPSFTKAMPSTARAMREAESAVPALGLLTLIFGLAYAASLGLRLWLGTPAFDFAGGAACFTAAMAVVVLSARSVVAYGVLTLNAVVHETLRLCPVPVVLAQSSDFYSRVTSRDTDPA